MMLPANAATLRGLTYFICGLYNVVFGNHSVRNPPWGELGSIYSARPGELHFTFFCDMGVQCSSCNNSKIYKIET